ncbi:MAG TPA: outer membrane beta-barrel protein [Pseudomonadales bacterium]
MKHLITAAILTLAATGASAQTYIGVGAAHFDDDTISITSLALTYDYKPNDNFAMQVALATGGDDAVASPIGPIEAELDYALSAKAKLGVTAGNAFLYGMAGYSNFNLEASARGFTISEDGNGSLLGVGVDFATPDTWGIGLEYARGFNDLEDTDIFQAVVRYGF